MWQVEEAEVSRFVPDAGTMVLVLEMSKVMILASSDMDVSLIMCLCPGKGGDGTTLPGQGRFPVLAVCSG
ncbi:MAG: hypothetical protein ACLTNK_00570 [Akkermansia muciniphila]